MARPLSPSPILALSGTATKQIFFLCGFRNYYDLTRNSAWCIKLCGKFDTNNSSPAPFCHCSKQARGLKQATLDCRGVFRNQAGECQHFFAPPPNFFFFDPYRLQTFFLRRSLTLFNKPNGEFSIFPLFYVNNSSYEGCLLQKDWYETKVDITYYMRR